MWNGSGTIATLATIALASSGPTPDRGVYMVEKRDRVRRNSEAQKRQFEAKAKARTMSID